MRAAKENLACSSPTPPIGCKETSARERARASQPAKMVVCRWEPAFPTYVVLPEVIYRILGLENIKVQCR